MLRQPLKSVQLLASAARTANGTAIVQLPEFDFNTLTVALDVTAKTGTTPTLDVYVQTTLDGGTTWLDCAHFTQLSDVATTTVYLTLPVSGIAALHGAITDAGLGSGSVAGLPIMSRSVRVKWVIGGSATPGNTFSVTGYMNDISRQG